MRRKAKARDKNGQTYFLTECPECKFGLCRSIWMRRCHTCNRLLCITCCSPLGNICEKCKETHVQ
jgi:hypothetical protein